MFVVDADKKTITLNRGDTGEVTITVSGYTYQADDRALFTIKDSSGSVVKQTVYEMTDNAFTVEFANADTDYLSPGIYYWDVRYIVNPQYDAQGNIVDGDGVGTPGSPFQIIILSTVGQV